MRLAVRTHPAKEFNLNDFGKNTGTRCPVDSTDYIDDDRKAQYLSCYFSSGEHKGKSKSLLILARELQLEVDHGIKLGDLHRVLSCHVAFKNISRLEKLRAKYNIKIIFNPKHHCEVNPIEEL